MPDERPISSSRITASDVARHSFGTVRRGFDPREVRSFLELLARQLADEEDLRQQWRQEVQDAEERARHPVLDEATITGALGQQSAQVLRKAHEEASRLVTDAEQRAAAILHDAEHRLAEASVRAEAVAAERIAEAELAAGAVNQQAGADAQASVEQGRRDAEELVARARDHGRSMVEEAQAARKRVLNDLAERRRGVHQQIEQLRAARDELVEAVISVRQRCDRITSDLAQVDEQARRAAAEAGPRTRSEPTDEEEVILAETAVVDEVLAGRRDPDERGPGAEIVQLTRAGDTGEVPAVTGGDQPDDQPSGAAHGSAAGTTAGTTSSGEPARDETDPDAGSIDSRSLEDLFARIRASQEASRAGEATAGDDEPVTEVVAVVEAEVITEDGGVVGEAVVTETVTETVTVTEAGPVVTGAEVTEVAEAPVEEALLAQREELLAPVTAALSRRVKRTLQDDQNRLLDAIRERSGAWSPDVLDDAVEHRNRFVEASTGPLGDAARAGDELARRVTGQPHDGAVPGSVPDVASIAEQLAGNIVTLLRRRLPGGEEGPVLDDVEDASDVVSAAYREWRGPRIERLVGDYALAALGAGVLGAANGPVRWVVGGDGQPCADCEDNSLAGELSPGEEFPTGQSYPPAHPGCRCLVAPAG